MIPYWNVYIILYTPSNILLVVVDVIKCPFIWGKTCWAVEKKLPELVTVVKGHGSRIILVFPYAYDTYSVKTGCPSLFIAYYVYSIVAPMSEFWWTWGFSSPMPWLWWEDQPFDFCFSHVFPETMAGWWLSPTPLKNMRKSVGMMTFPIWWKVIKKIFETTSQYIYPDIY